MGRIAPKQDCAKDKQNPPTSPEQPLCLLRRWCANVAEWWCSPPPHQPG
ncbi:MAG TPA: hypothetical protein VF727_01500 [Allosphingosinicella sp.]|jgi:hypothetical protein